MSEITLASVDQMSAHDFAQKMQSDPTFRETVDRLSAPEVDVPMPEVQPAPAPVDAPPTAPVVGTIREHRFQPVDEFGRKLGGEQVIRYTSPEELAQKLTDQNVLLVRKLREVTRKQTLGIQDPVEESSLPRFEGPIALEEHDLSAEDRFQIAQDLQDPEKFKEGRDRLLESAFGVKPSALRNTLNDISMRQLQQDALNQYTIFLSETTDYIRNSENDQTLTAYMRKHGLPPTVEGFKYAHDKVKTAGLLVDTPPVHEVTVPPAPTPAPPALAPVPEPVVANSQPPVAAGTRIDSAVQPQTKRQVIVPSGLNDRVSSNSTPRSEGITISLADIDNMPSAQYKKWIQVPVNRELVNRLEKEKLERQRMSMPQ